MKTGLDMEPLYSHIQTCFSRIYNIITEFQQPSLLVLLSSPIEYR